MSEPKTLRNVRADVERTGLNQSIRTGRVAVRAVPGWLKTETYAEASLSPKQARRLAVDLLLAADKAETEQW